MNLFIIILFASLHLYPAGIGHVLFWSTVYGTAHAISKVIQIQMYMV